MVQPAAIWRIVATATEQEDRIAGSATKNVQIVAQCGAMWRKLAPSDAGWYQVAPYSICIKNIHINSKENSLAPHGQLLRFQAPTAAAYCNLPPCGANITNECFP